MRSPARGPGRGQGRGSVGLLHYYTLGFGTIIGSAWVVLLGDWLMQAGPGGVIVGFLAGGLVMMLVGACYSGLIVRMPEAGSEFIYAYRVFGRAAGFAVGWFLVLYLVAVTVYEALALPWVLELLFPAVGGITLYTAFGSPVTSGGFVIGIGVCAIITVLNLMGTRTAVRAHSLLTAGFLGTALLVIAAMLSAGHIDNAVPIWSTMTGNPWWVGAAGMFAFCAYGLNGFQAVPQTIEDRSSGTALRSIALVPVVSIGLATVFYCLIVLAVSVASPWQALTHAPLAAVAAAASLPAGRFLSAALLAATATSLLKAWNGIFMMAVRLLLAMARQGLLPAPLVALHGESQVPRLAVLTVAGLNAAGLLLGRGAVEPITDMCAMVLTLTYIMCCATVLLLRRRAGVPTSGDTLVWLALIGAAIMALAAFLTPFWQGRGGVPLEFKLLLAWSVVGVASWFAIPVPVARST